jgi:serine/threonine protein kinase
MKSLNRMETFKSVRAEMNNLRQLDHEHCAKLLGSYFVRDEHFYSFCIVLPWYEFSLENLYKNEQVQGIPSANLTELRNSNFVVTTIGCIVNAVHYLHNVVKIKHLDLKPPNILFKKENDSYTLKLCDFGVSSAFSKDSLGIYKVNISVVNQIGKSPTFGTEFYQSPEQATNQLTRRSSDIYSLGVVIFELLVWCEGEKPGVLRGVRGFGKSIASQDHSRVEIFFNALVKSKLKAFSPLVFNMLNRQVLHANDIL